MSAEASKENIILQDHKADKAMSEPKFSDLQLSEFVLEFLGNFCIVTSIYFNGGTPVLTPVMVGLLITLIGPVSGAHFNIAVTLVVLLISKHHDYPRLTSKKVIGFFIAQVSGTVVASVFNCLFMGWEKLIKIAPGQDVLIFAALALELFLTFLLLLYTSVCCHPKASRESYLNGVVFFVFVFIAGTCTGQYSGASFNPSIALSFGSLNLIVQKDVTNFLVMLAYVAFQLAAVPIVYWIYKFLLSDAMYPKGDIPSLKDEHPNQDLLEINLLKPQSTEDVPARVSNNL